MTVNPHKLSVEELLHINECCDLFEDALRRNPTISIGPYLEYAQANLRERVLRELLLTEASVRSELDMTMMTVETYLDELPQYESILRDFFVVR